MHGNPIQYSCLENPMDGGAWQAAVHRVAKSQPRLSNSLCLFTFMHWRRKWQPTPVFLPGESQGQGSLVGCRLWGCTESDTTEVTQQQQHSILIFHFQKDLILILTHNRYGGCQVVLVKNPPASSTPGGGHGNPLQYSCLEKPMDRGAWWAIVHRVAVRHH